MVRNHRPDPAFESPDLRSPSVSWFPGHMYKAQKRLASEVRHIDVVVEMRDARLPLLSGNPELERIIGDRRRLLLFNKASLAEPRANKEWQAHFTEKGLTALFIDADSRSGLNLIFPPLRELTAEGKKKFERKGIRPPMQRLMVVGMPNVGKSTFINRVIRENRLKTAPSPGVTRGVQWVELKKGYLLMDTPGVMLPRIGDEEAAYRLGWINAIRDSILGAERVAKSLLAWLSGRPGEHPATFYRVDCPAGASPDEILQAVCEKRGYLKSGSVADLERGANVILSDFRAGKLGRFTLEDLKMEGGLEKGSK